ncbi:MAG: hypothetical protein AAF085_01065 [Planctomycetota bacterium]
MSSWVRYSVAVYLGLLISGALARQPSRGPSPEPPPAPSVFHEVPTPTELLPASPKPTSPANTDVSV